MSARTTIPNAFAVPKLFAIFIAFTVRINVQMLQGKSITKYITQKSVRNLESPESIPEMYSRSGG